MFQYNDTVDEHYAKVIGKYFVISLAINLLKTTFKNKKPTINQSKIYFQAH